jgi:hypothetical protein
LSAPSTAVIELAHQPIVEFHLDEKGYWVAELGCGHNITLHEGPPGQLREWVTTAKGRARMLGLRLECCQCDGPAAA